MKRSGLLESVNDTGLILIADDQFVNRQAIELVVEDLGIKERTKIFENGQQVIEFLDKSIEATEKSPKKSI